MRFRTNEAKTALCIVRSCRHPSVVEGVGLATVLRWKNREGTLTGISVVYLNSF